MVAGRLVTEPNEFEQVRPSVYKPAIEAVAVHGEVGDVTSVQPGRFTELPLTDADPVQDVAPVTAQLTWNGDPVVPIAGTVRTKLFGLGGLLLPPATTAELCAKPVEFVHVMPKLYVPGVVIVTGTEWEPAHAAPAHAAVPEGQPLAPLAGVP